MNINIFFVIVSFGLLSIFILFKPLGVEQKNFVDVPIFELNSFTLYELDTKGLVTLMKGDEAIRYSDRYQVSNINYTDNSKKFFVNMKANNGLFKDEVVSLSGDVNYKRGDGLNFKTQKASYNKKTKIAYIDTKYIAYMGENEITGSSLEYNNRLNIAKSKNIVAKYQLQEDTKWKYL